MTDRKYSDGTIWDNSIDRDDAPDGSEGGYTLNGNYIVPEAMMEIIDLRKQMYLDNMGEVSDGRHTFNELYDFRMVYNAALFNEWARRGIYSVHKSYRHHDGEECFGGGWFIVVAMLPTGQISNHYKNEFWNLFRVPSYEKAQFEYDGHTSGDVLERLKAVITQGS